MSEEAKEKPPLSSTDMIRRLRIAQPRAFVQLRDLHGGSEHKALKAMREEMIFIAAHPNLPTGQKFAEQVRGWLMAHGLPWSQENLEKAVAAVQAPPAAKAANDASAPSAPPAENPPAKG